MENISELKQHLHAVTQTRQISNAMYLLSTSRIRKSMQNIDYNLTYMRKLRATMKDIVSKTKHTSLSDPFIELTEGGKALFFVITSDKGLCGGYNSAVVSLALQKMREYKETVVYSLGLKGTEMFLSRGIKPDESWYGASQRPSLYSARDLGERIVELYDDCTVSEVYIVYTEYVNSAVQRPVCKRVLPLLRRDFDDVEYENKIKDLETKYKSKIDNLEYENSKLNKIIDKFKTNLKKFMKWICNKFSYPCEDDLIRDFNKETYSNIDFEQQLDVKQFEQDYEDEIDFDIY